jgi:SHS2 domain-containing protein
MNTKEAFRRAEKLNEKVVPYKEFVEMAQKFLQEHEGEDSDEMLARDLGRLLSITWEAGKTIQNHSEISLCME